MAVKKKHMAVLQNINATIPKEYTDNLLIEQKIAPLIEKSVIDFLAGKKIPKALAERYKGHEEEQHMFDAGMFSKTEWVADPVVEKKINDYLNKEIKKAIKLGLLPPKVDKLTAKAKSKCKK